MVTDYGMDDGGVGVRVPLGSRIFSSPRSPDTLGSVERLGYELDDGGIGSLICGRAEIIVFFIMSRPAVNPPNLL
jgi:hypothetical protein